MKAYPEYKDSGIEWLGEIPAHWEKCKLKNLLKVKDGTHDTPKTVEKKKGTFPLVTSKNLRNGNIDFEDTNHISEEDYKKWLFLP